MNTKKFSWKWVLYFLLAVFIISLYKGCQRTYSNCSYTERVEKLQTMSDERLAKLYYDMKAFYDLDSTTSYYAFTEKGLPSEFSDLDINVVDPHSALIVIGGCFDDKAFLKFRGYKNDIYPTPEIFMHWGDHYNSGSESIWRLEK